MAATRSLSIFSSDRSWSWSCVFKLFSWLLIGALGIAYLFVLVIDPYNALGWSPGWERRPVDERHRYFAPGLARMARFDSAVLGNSTAMLLKPNLLNAQLGGTFVNLGMPSATPYEQLRLLDVFLDSRSTLETVLFGIDGSWCYAHEPFPAFSGVGKLNPFPDELYDHNRMNNLPTLSLDMLTLSLRQLAVLLGGAPPPYADQGWYRIVADDRSYSLEEARRRIYLKDPQAEPDARPESRMHTNGDPDAWRYPDVLALENVLRKMPSASRKILMLVPYHVAFLPKVGRYAPIWVEECKKRLHTVANGVPNTVLVDFMIPSEITTLDDNYWDAVHYREAIADELVRLLALGVAGESGEGQYLLDGSLVSSASLSGAAERLHPICVESCD